MNKLIDLISAEVCGAFSAAGYDAELGRVSISNRPDLCEYQCNGAMKGAKLYHKAPIQIASDVAAKLADSAMFEQVDAVNPGFLNLTLSPDYLADYLNRMRTTERFGIEQENPPRTIVVDYGGANVAKPLHVGHIRPAIIGEALKRIYRYLGNRVIGDVHLGDWGLQMGLIVEMIRDRMPELPYFDDNFTGEYPAESPVTVSELEEIYPAASARSKEDAEFSARAHEATRLLQIGKPGYLALWRHIMAVSVADLKKNYAGIEVDFDLWKGESDAEPYIAPMIEKMRANGSAVESEGALVIPVAQDDDKVEIPPCILLKSDGATLYATTDLATLVQREQDFAPDKVLYVVDKRQALHFEQVFRAARRSGIVRPETELQHLGFGTMNGKDGKPFKTRAGGVMRLEYLLGEITDAVRARIEENKVIPAEDVEQTAHQIAVAALKYGDLSNLPTKDYCFDIDRFTAFEGNTGPYILYTIVRIKSILSKYDGDVNTLALRPAATDGEKALMLSISRFADNLTLAARDTAPNTLCAYIYELASAVNSFYHDTKILSEPDEAVRGGYLALIALTKSILETSIDLLGFSAPDKM
jgi:arginyl-tRNA synthetase